MHKAHCNSICAIILLLASNYGHCSPTKEIVRDTNIRGRNHSISGNLSANVLDLSDLIRMSQTSPNEDIEMYSIIVKNKLPERGRRGDYQAEYITLNLEGDSEGQFSQLKNIATLIVDTAEDNQIEQVPVKIISKHGKETLINIFDSTSANLEMTENAINDLVDTNVVFSGNKKDNVVYGYIPIDRQSSGSKLLQLNETDKTNIVNVLIINIINTDEERESIDVVDFNSHYFENGNFFNTYTDNEEPPNEKLSNIFSLIKSTSLLNLPEPANIQTHSQDIILKAPIPNPNGLYLNKNTILNLLPDFVRATTIPPVIPLYEKSKHPSLQMKPSVLGLLPNQVFGIKALKSGDDENAKVDGIIIRKDGLRDPSYLQENVLKNISLPNNEDKNYIAKLANINQMKNEELLKYVLHLFNATYARNTNTNSMLKGRNIDSIALEPIQRKNKKGNIEPIVKAMAIGSLPSGIAFASAILPYISPFVLGKKRRKRDALKDDSEVSIINNNGYDKQSRNLDKMNEIDTSLVEEANDVISQKTNLNTENNLDLHMDTETFEVPEPVNDDEILLNFLSSTIHDWQNDTSIISDGIPAVDNNDGTFKDISSNIKSSQDNIEVAFNQH